MEYIGPVTYLLDVSGRVLKFIGKVFKQTPCL
jgi:hypothetical protein